MAANPFTKRKASSGGASPTNASSSPPSAGGDQGERMASDAQLSELKRTMDLAEAVMSHIESNALGPMDRQLYIMEHGVETQKIASASHLHFYVADEAAARGDVAGVVAAMCQHARGATEAVQLAYGQGLETCTEQFSRMDLLAQNFVCVAGTTVTLTAGAVRAVWSKTLARTVAAASAELRSAVAVPWVDAAMQSPDERARLVACALLAELLALDGAVIADRLWETTMRLAGDPSVAVVGAFVEVLDSLCDAGGPAMAHATVLPVLLEQLVCHEDNRVASGTFLVLLKMCAATRSQALRETLLAPVLMGYVTNQPPLPLEYYVTELLGQMVCTCGLLQLGDNAAVMFKYITGVLRGHNMTLRKWVAFNAPAIFLAYSAHAPAFVPRLIEAHEVLSNDSSPLVRIHVAASFHEVLAITGDKYGNVKTTYLRLLEDADPAVKDRVFMRTPAILQALSKLQPDDGDWRAFVRKLLAPLSSYEEVIASNWRKLQQLFRLFDSITQWLAAADVHTAFIPLLLKHVTHGACALRADAAAFLARTFALTCAESQKALVIPLLSKVLRMAHNDSSWLRGAFIRVVVAFRNHLSPQFSRLYFAQLMAQLLADPVAAIQAQAAAAVGELHPEVAKQIEALAAPPTHPSTPLMAKNNNRSMTGSSPAALLAEVSVGRLRLRPVLVFDEEVWRSDVPEAFLLVSSTFDKVVVAAAQVSPRGTGMRR
jgi:hypothetical protein